MTLSMDSAAQTPFTAAMETTPYMVASGEHMTIFFMDKPEKTFCLEDQATII